MGNRFSSHLEVGNMMVIKGLQFLPSLVSLPSARALPLLDNSGNIKFLIP